MVEGGGPAAVGVTLLSGGGDEAVGSGDFPVEVAWVQGGVPHDFVDVAQVSDGEGFLAES